MQTAAKGFENSILANLTQKAGPVVAHAIKTAAQKTGVNFAYLMEQAAVESSFRADAKAKTSSASGLYQFIERTWLAMVRDHGDKYGLSQYTDKIDARGKVTDPALRKEILALRNDPETAALMAGEFAAENKRYLEQYGDRIGPVGATELYLAHFMGAGGAAEFLKAYKSNPVAAAADLMPQAARANYNVFYNTKTGKPRTVAEVYALFDKKFSASKNGIAGDMPATGTAAPPAERGDPARIAAGRADSPPAAMTVRGTLPVLPGLSPFAHLNARDEDGANDDEGRLLRDNMARTLLETETISWNAPALRGSAALNPAEVLLMAQLSANPLARR